MSEELTIKLIRREDGGLQICSDDAPGLILSCATPGGALSSVWPALHALKHPITVFVYDDKI